MAHAKSYVYRERLMSHCWTLSWLGEGLAERLLQQCGWLILQHHVKEMVMDEGERVCSFMMAEITTLKKQRHRFSVTFDEWTSTKNWKYMNIKVHAKGPKYRNLGLICVNASMIAEKKCVELLQAKVTEFGVSLENNICTFNIFSTKPWEKCFWNAECTSSSKNP